MIFSIMSRVRTYDIVRFGCRSFPDGSCLFTTASHQHWMETHETIQPQQQDCKNEKAAFQCGYNMLHTLNV